MDITEGNVLKNVLYMGIPSVIGFGAMTIYALTDIYWVGPLGMSHVAALTMFGSIAWILGSTNQIVGTGSVALISRRYGEREYEATRDVIRQTLLLKFSLAVIMAVIGLLLVPVIIRFMSDDPDVRRHHAGSPAHAADDLRSHVTCKGTACGGTFRATARSRLIRDPLGTRRRRRTQSASLWKGA